MKTVQIRTMTIGDSVFGQRLSRQARWNQSEADWLRLLNFEPEGCFVAELDGSVVGTTTTCILGQVAWIAMVLVDENHRRRGIGAHLLKHALDYLDGRRVPTIRLDATQLGRPMYEKLGFVPEYELVRYEGIASSCSPSIIVNRTTTDTYPDIIEFDKMITSTNREKMLIRLFHEFPYGLRTLWRQSKIEGYATLRPGADAVQIGPCVAVPDSGPVLLYDALGRCAGKHVLLDVPLDNEGAVKIAESSGLKIQRCFTRMCRDEQVYDKVEALWASSGPEKG